METCDGNTTQSTDLSALPPAVLQLLEEKDTLLNEHAYQIQTLTAKLNWFEEQFKLLKHKHYSKSTEKQTAVQLSIFDEDELATQTAPEEPETEEVTYTRKKPQRNKTNLDTSHLPREQNIIDLCDNEKYCSCGCELKHFGEESKEELIFQPLVLKVIEHIRLKYMCRDCESVKMPPAVELPIPKSKASASLLTEVILNKYRYHLPFYRQHKMFANYQINIPDNTLAGWAMKAASQLAPLEDAFCKQLTQVNCLQVDETPVKVLKPEKKGYMWVYHCYLPNQRFVLFDFNLSRGAKVVNERLKNFTGLLQTDGYSGYGTQRQRGDIITLGCWDHARRKFTDVVKACGQNKSGKAGQMLERIAKLYAIERQIKALPYDERKAIRQAQAKPKLNAIYELLYKINAPPKSLLGAAVTYCKNQWSELIRYIDYGQAQISNCWVENLIRPFALGRRSWLFVGTEESASRAALLYSLIQSCELNDIDPRAYLVYVLNQVHRMRRQKVDPMTLLPNTIDRDLLQPLSK